MRTGRPKKALVLSEEEQDRLQSLTHRGRSQPLLARRARVVLACGQGLDNKTVARNVLMVLMLIVVGLCTSVAWAQTAHWPEQKANSWYAQQPWLIGSNYVPKSAINQLEMWQEATFDPAEIDTEFNWAEAKTWTTTTQATTEE